MTSASASIEAAARADARAQARSRQRRRRFFRRAAINATAVLVFLVERTSLSKLYDVAFSGYAATPAGTSSAQKAAKVG